MGTTAQKLEYLNTTKTKIKESINLTNANITDEPFRQYAVILKNRLPEIVGDPSIIWNNYEHVTGSGTSITISTYKSIFEYILNGDTTQSGTPTPDAPVPINVVTGNQTITISDGTDSTVQYINLGKNLYDNTKLTNASNSGITATNNNGTIICNGTATANAFINISTSQAPILLKKGTYTLSANNSSTIPSGGYLRLMNTSGITFDSTVVDMSTANAKTTFTFTNDTVVLFQLRFPSGISLTNFEVKPQLEVGSTATSFVPYFVPIELCKIGTYQDKIYKSNGKWYLHKEIGKVVLDGTESWSQFNNSSFSNTITRFRTDVANVNGDSDYVVRVISNYFKGGNLNIRNVESITTQFNASQLNVFINISTASDVAAFKTWLSTHNTIVYYVLSTATTEEIKEYDLLNDLNSLELMTGSISITISGDLPSPIDITAIKN